MVVDSFPNKYEGKGVRQNNWSEKRGLSLVVDSFPNKYEGIGFRKTGVNKSTTGEQGREGNDTDDRKRSAGSME